MSNEPNFPDPFRPAGPPPIRRRQKKKTNWLLVGLLIALGISPFVCGGVGFFMIKRWANNIAQFDGLIDRSPVADNPGERASRMERSKEVLAEIINGNRFKDISPHELADVRDIVTKLTDAMEADSDAQFTVLIDDEAFEERVFNSSQASGAARFYQFQFEDWITFYCPEGTTPRLLAVSRESNGELAMHLSMDPDGQRSITSFYLARSGRNLKIIDWVSFEGAMFYSEQSAREFSCAVADDTPFNNYYALMSNSVDPSGDVRKQLTDYLHESYPPQLQAESFLLLAQFAESYGFSDLAKLALDKIPEGYRTPDILQARAYYHAAKEENEQALEYLDSLADLVGPLPDAAELRASVLLSLDRPDEAIDAWLDVARLGPGFLEDYSLKTFLTEHLPPARSADLVDAIKTSGATSDEIAAFTSDVIDYSRMDLAQSLLQLIETDNDSPPSLALQAQLAQADGNIEAAIAKYAQAIKTSTDKAQTDAWRYAWGSLLESIDAGDVAIRESPNPAVMFTDLALDDGYLLIESEVARKYAKALADVDIPDKKLRLAAELWSRAAFLLADLEDSNDSAWPLADKLHADYSALPEAEVKDNPTLSELGYWLDSWVIQAGVATGHVTETYDRIGESMCSDAVFDFMALPANKRIEALTALAAAHRKAKPKDPWLDYCRAEVMIAKGADASSVREALLAYYKQLEDDQSDSTTYRTIEWLARDAAENGTWKDLLNTLPLQAVFWKLSDELQAAGKSAEVEELFQLASTDPALAEQGMWLRRRVQYLAEKERWPEVAKLAQTIDQNNSYLHDLVLKAFLVTDRLDDARTHIARMPSARQSSARLHLAIAEGASQDELIQLARPLARYELTSLYDEAHLFERLQSAEFAEFRNRFPQNLRTYTLVTRLLLCIDAPELTTDSIKQAIEPTLGAAEVVLLPESLQFEDRGVKGWRIDTADVSLLLSQSQRPYDEQLENQSPQRDQIQDSQALAAVEKHDSWIAIDIDWQKPDNNIDSVEIANGLAADLLATKLQCLAVGSPGAMVLPNNKSADWVRQGEYESEDSFTVRRQFRQTNSEQNWLTKRARLYQTLRSTEQSSDLNLKLNYAMGPVEWKPIPIDTHDWTPKHAPQTLTGTSDSPLLPRIFRNRKVALSVSTINSE